MTRWYFGGLNMSDEGCSRFNCNAMTFVESLKVTGFIIRISVRNVIFSFQVILQSHIWQYKEEDVYHLKNINSRIFLNYEYFQKYLEMTNIIKTQIGQYCVFWKIFYRLLMKMTTRQKLVFCFNPCSTYNL